MSRLARPVSLGIGLLVLLSAAPALAALPPAYYTSSQSDCKNPAQPCGTTNKIITFYVPHSGANCATSLQGCIATSKPGLDGKAEPISVDAVRLGKAKYATCASDPSNYGNYYNIGTITYRSALDMQKYTVQNVVCYVHDTGGAFRGRPDKLDLATTLCPTCTEAQAASIGRGGAVNIAGTGVFDRSVSALTSGFLSGLTGNQVLSQDYYCITSVTPVVVTNVPAGTPFPSNCYNKPPQAATQSPIAQLISRLTAPSAQSAPQSPVTPISQPTPTTPTPTTSGTSTPAALLIAQPTAVSQGNPLLVSWSSVGMSTGAPCRVLQNGTLLSAQNAGSKVVQTKALSGTVTFTLTCTTLAGSEEKQTAIVQVN